MPRNKITIENILLTFVCTIALFSYSYNMTEMIVVPKQLYTFLALSIATIVLSIKLIVKKRINIDPFASAVIVSLLSGLEAIYALAQFVFYLLSGINTHVSGSFDNPAGLITSLCLGLPFSIYAFQTAKSNRKLYLCTTMLIILTIIISASRTGIIIVLLVCAFAYVDNYKHIALKTIILYSILFLGIVAVLYLIKQDSADGRLLIWRASWPLIESTPFWGYGVGAFNRFYMDAQASYLQNFPPDSEYAMLASNVIVPFNEYISFYLAYGVAGCIGLIMCMCLYIWAYFKNPDQGKKYAMLSLSVLAFIAFFSYPLTYSISYVIIILSTLIVWNKVLVICKLKILRTIAIMGILLIGILVCIRTMNVIAIEKAWYVAYVEKDLSKYKQLKLQLNTVPHFLYSYAYELFRQKEYDLSLDIATQCSDLISNYDLELLIGDIYMKKRDYKNAEKHYRKASMMCPCRFIPLEALYDTYTALGQNEQANQIAHIIVEKPIKVQSRIVKLIKYKMKKALGFECKTENNVLNKKTNN